MLNDKRMADTSEAWELFLLGLRYRDSKLITLSGNEPFLLSGSDQAWLVYQGTVDVFAVQLVDGQPSGARYHLFRAYTNQLLLGIDLADQPVGLLASCAPQTQVLRFSRDRLKQQMEKPEHIPLVHGMLEEWIRALSSGITVPVKPKTYLPLEAGQEIAVEANRIARSTRDVVWVRQTAGSTYFMGRDDLPALSGDQPFPLSEYNWLRAAEPGTLQVLSTADVLGSDNDWSPLDRFHALLLGVVQRDIELNKATASRLIQEQAANDELKVQTAFTRLASTWNAEPLPILIGVDAQQPLVAACALVGQALGVTIKAPPDFDSLHEYQNPLQEIARASRVRVRWVLLRDDWWLRDNGPLLAFRGEERQPVALLPVSARRYELHDPVKRERIPVDEAVAASVQPVAYMFYRPFPDRRLSAWDVLRFGGRGARLDVLMLLVVGIAGGVIGLVVPIVTRLIFDTLIPSGEHGQLIVMGGILAASAVAVALFQVVRSVSLLRIEGRMDSAIQAAVWDRLLSLPADFFRQYSAGDLAERAMGISLIKQILSGSVMLAVLSGLFSWFYLALMFYYDASLALITVGLVFLATVITAVFGVQLVRYERQVTHRQGQISGLIAQLVGGIAKLRVAGAESRAFFLWASAFSEQKKLAFRARTIDNYQVVFAAAYPIVAAMFIYALMNNRSGLSTGTFLAFYTAFTLFLSAGLMFSAALISALSIVPVYERLKPILQTLPEVDEQKTYPGELSGSIEVNHVSFRYEKDGPLILDDVTFSVKSGEFIALVGPSGSGKSTLLRHLLGFESPDSGAIYYDGLALTEVDLRAVRQQIGVVLQHSQVMTGSILDNIVGASNLPVEEAWDAARRAGIADDIKQMPMGMQTYISEGGSTFSGGQRQRLLIARALVTRPRIIFFDEATSALDDQSQAMVTDSLKRLDATRIVIAHRLSTVVDADHILVLKRGKVVESGTYQELMTLGGVFAELAQRQLV
jgi:NHLM bacteriocin system ABC transporter ATP-binding protein